MIKYDISKDEIVLHLEDSKYIMGYTIVGGYDENNGDVKISRSILPDGFFTEFVSTKYVYYKNTNEVIYNKNFKDNAKSIEDADYQPPKESVPKEDYKKLESEVEELKRMLQELLSKKG
ncbi:hypothetical protein [Staphylococcus phage vB_SauM-V1SA22]|nr:hypothetical protein [Staphylococcus phage vB_SauM-V1SA22]